MAYNFAEVKLPTIGELVRVLSKQRVHLVAEYDSRRAPRRILGVAQSRSAVSIEYPWFFRYGLNLGASLYIS